jgi:IPT/TIG domain.
MKNLFTNTKMILTAFSAITLLVITFAGCETKPDPSAYDPNFKGSADPIVTSLSPANSGYAGITVVNITGSNFSANKAEDFVYFGDNQATVLAATSTTLKVLVPNVVDDSMYVRVAVLSAMNWGYYSQKFSTSAAASEFGDLKSSELPYAVTSDDAGNIYISITSFSIGAGIIKIAPDGTRTAFAPKGGETSWASLKVGPNGDLYGARSVKAIFQIQAGKAATTYQSSGLGTITDIDFDANKNIWAVGNNDYIYSVSTAKVTKSFAYKGSTRAVRVFATGGKNYVYVGGKVDTLEKVYRMEIKSAAGDAVGSPEEVFNLTDKYPGSQILALTFALDGDMYIGTDDKTAPVLIVHPDKTYEPLYQGVLYRKAQAFTWTGNTMYYSRAAADTTQAIIKVKMDKPGAPYYGK